MATAVDEGWNGRQTRECQDGKETAKASADSAEIVHLLGPVSDVQQAARGARKRPLPFEHGRQSRHDVAEGGPLRRVLVPARLREGPQRAWRVRRKHGALTWQDT